MCSLGNFALEPQIVQNLQLGQRGNLWNADAMHNIHWYTLIPLDGPPEENDKSMPGTKSPEEALFYFERDFPHHRHLYIIPDGTAAGPFGHIGRHQAQAALQCIQQAGLVTAACANCLDRGSQQSPRWRKGDSNHQSRLEGDGGQRPRGGGYLSSQNRCVGSCHCSAGRLSRHGVAWS